MLYVHSFFADSVCMLCTCRQCHQHTRHCTMMIRLESNSPRVTMQNASLGNPIHAWLLILVMLNVSLAFRASWRYFPTSTGVQLYSSLQYTTRRCSHRCPRAAHVMECLMCSCHSVHAIHTCYWKPAKVSSSYTDMPSACELKAALQVGSATHHQKLTLVGHTSTTDHHTNT